MVSRQMKYGNVPDMVVEFDLLNECQRVSVVSTHVTDVTTAVDDLPRCRVRLSNGVELLLAHSAREVVQKLFPHAV